MRIAQLQNNRITAIATVAWRTVRDPFVEIPWEAELGDGFVGGVVIKPPGVFYAWDGGAWAYDAAAEATYNAQQARDAADVAARAATKAEAIVQYLVTHTPAECAQYVQTNVTDLASAKVILAKFAMVLSVLARRELRD